MHFPEFRGIQESSLWYFVLNGLVGRKAPSISLNSVRLGSWRRSSVVGGSVSEVSPGQPPCWYALQQTSLLVQNRGHPVCVFDLSSHMIVSWVIPWSLIAKQMDYFRFEKRKLGTKTAVLKRVSHATSAHAPFPYLVTHGSNLGDSMDNSVVLVEKLENNKKRRLNLWPYLSIITKLVNSCNQIQLPARASCSHYARWWCQ